MSNTVNKIFAKSNVLNAPNNVQKIQYNREYLLSSTASELNTYLNMGVFPTFSDTYATQYVKDENGDWQEDVENTVIGVAGVRSLFNRAGTVIIGPNVDGTNTNIDPSKGDLQNTHPWRIVNNVPLMDSPKARQRIREHSGCTIKELVKASETGMLGRATYAYSDFMYCKHLGKVSNNYLVTLRRFPLPVDDFINAQGEDESQWNKITSQNASCIGCMVTWIGVSGNTMEGLLKYSYKQPFKEQTASEQENNQNADNNQTKLNGLFSLFDKNYRNAYMNGKAGEAVGGLIDNSWNTHVSSMPGMLGKIGSKYGQIESKTYYSGQEYWSFRDQNKVYGPIDSIRSTYVREDSGLTFDHKISLVFEYELRSYNGINGRQAMLDLISNILNVTYTTGTFWGGGYKATGAHQSNIFANLEIFKQKGGFTDFMDAFASDLVNIGKSAGNSITGGAAIGEGGLKNAWKNFLSGMNSIGGMLIGGMLNKLGRPQKQMFHSLLSPAPIGFWHVTIGNPKHPIMSIGNMIITNVTIEHNGPLGLDDFPTGLKVTVELDRGKPRDLRDIEKLYMQGNDRIYHSMGPKVFDMYANSVKYKGGPDGTAHNFGYEPINHNLNINREDKDYLQPTTNIKEFTDTLKCMKKYFGTEDTYSIYVPAAEQEFGAGKKKPSTEENKNVTGARNGK
jgi:hypothetical protein